MTASHTLDGIAVHAQTAGDPGAPPVVLLHGWGASAESMSPLSERLAPLGYRVHALDLPGFGRSELPPTAWGVPDYAQFVAHYLDSVQIARANLIGHSFGGRISIVLGADMPERVHKIVLTDSAGVLTPLSARQRLRQRLGRALQSVIALPGLNALQPAVQAWYLNRYASADYKAAGALTDTFLKVIQQDLVPVAARIKASTLLIWGDQDHDTPLWHGQLLEKTIPDAGLVVFKGAGHFAYQERILDFVRIVDTFFKGK